MKRNIVASMAVFLLILSTAGSVLFTSSQSGLKDIKVSPIRTTTTAQYQTSEPIIITSNVGFGLLDATGVGTPSNPYTFENLEISDAGSCIVIQDTNAHFLISNCKLETSDLSAVIVFDNVENGRVEQCEITGVANGFELSRSIDCIVTDNSIYGTYTGIVLLSTSNCTVSNNRLHSNNRGILFELSDHCQILNNSIYSNRAYGIELTLLSHNNTVYGNSIGWNDVAVGSGGNALDSGMNNTFDDGSSNGNFWSDFNASEPYLIPGSGDSIDSFAQLLEDIVSPVIVPLSDTAIDVETSSNTLTWLAYDTLPRSYFLQENDLEVVSSIWNGGEITVGLDHLPVGTHEFTITLYDGAGNSATDDVLVTVISFILGGIGTELVMIASGLTLAIFVVIILLVKKLSK